MEKNFAYWTEYTRLGFTLSNHRGFLYSKLQCSGNDVQSVEGEFFPASPLYTIRFCNNKNYANWLAVANEDGTVCIHNSDDGRDGTVKVFQAHYNAIFDLAWLEDDVKLVTSSGDHSALLWDLGRGEAVPVVRMVGHQGSVKAVACKPGDPNVFTTGARDGVIMQWDIRTNSCRSNVSDEEGFRSVKADKIIKFSHLKNALYGLSRHKNVEKALENSQCISSVVYQDPLAIISCSSTDKTIKLWDTRKTYSAFKGIPTPMQAISREVRTTNRVGYTSLAVSPCRLRVYAYCTDAQLYAFNIGAVSSEPIATYKSPGTSSFFCKINVSPDGRFLSSGSSDGKGYIWSTASPDQQLVTLEGHTAEVTCVDWCKHGELKLASCSDDGTFRIWKVNTGKERTDSDRESAIGGHAVVPKDVVVSSGTRRKFFATHDPKIRKRRWSTTVDASPKKPSPKKLCVTPKKVESFLSELPNYIVDGRSPHEPSRRVPASPAPDGDWLRRLIAATPPPPAKSSAKKTRRTLNQAGKSSARGNLLRYFKKSDESSTSEKSKSDEVSTSDQPDQNVNNKL